MRIGHYQCICRQGDFDANLRTVVHGLDLAAEAGLAIVSFPESLLTGYFRDEYRARANCFPMDSPQMQELARRTARYECLFMVGFNESRGDDLYNTVVVMERGKILGRYSKAFPIYRYFVPGREFPVFSKDDLVFGVVICADGGYIEPCRILAIKGARMVFAPHFNYVADPIRHSRMVRNDHIARAVENGIHFLRGNNVMAPEDNGQISEGAAPRYGYGDSYLIDPDGEIAAGAGLYDEYLMIYNLDLSREHRSRRDRNVRSAVALLDILARAIESRRSG